MTHKKSDKSVHSERWHPPTDFIWFSHKKYQSVDVWKYRMMINSLYALYLYAKRICIHTNVLYLFRVYRKQKSTMRWKPHNWIMTKYDNHISAPHNPLHRTPYIHKSLYGEARAQSRRRMMYIFIYVFLECFCEHYRAQLPTHIKRNIYIYTSITAHIKNKKK